MEQNNSLTAKIAGGIVITAIVMIGIYFFILNAKPSPDSSSTFSATPSELATGASSPTSSTEDSASAGTDSGSTATTPTNTSNTSNNFKDGSYSAVAGYRVPGGENAIKVSISLKGGVVTSLSTQDSYSDHESAGYISSFKDGLSGEVVGKKIDRVSLSRYNGASDTSQGFDEALMQIMSQAKA